MDRDGTIIRQVELLYEPSEIKLLPRAAAAIRAMNRMGYLVIVITNQPVVARGIASEKEVDSVHAFLIRQLGSRKAKIDAIYYCPHHPKADVKKYRMICDCRKPAPGLILQAAEDHNIDLAHSFFIGDSTRDVLAANRAKVKMILVKTGHGGNDPWQFEGKPDFVAKDLIEAAKIIKKNSNKK